MTLQISVAYIKYIGFSCSDSADIGWTLLVKAPSYKLILGLHPILIRGWALLGSWFIHGDGKNTRRQHKSSKHTWSLCYIIFTNILLSKANHMAKLSINGVGKYTALILLRAIAYIIFHQSRWWKTIIQSTTITYSKKIVEKLPTLQIRTLAQYLT